MKTGKEKMLLYAAMMLVAMIAGTILANGVRERERVWDFGAWSAQEAEEAYLAYGRDGSADSLVHALKGQCWRYQVQGDESAKARVIELGQALLERAKAGTVDLEALDSDGVVGQALQLIRQLGVR